MRSWSQERESKLVIEYDKEEKGVQTGRMRGDISGSSVSIRTTLEHKQAQRQNTRKWQKSYFAPKKGIRWMSNQQRTNRRYAISLKDTEGERRGGYNLKSHCLPTSTGSSEDKWLLSLYHWEMQRLQMITSIV